MEDWLGRLREDDGEPADDEADRGQEHEHPTARDIAMGEPAAADQHTGHHGDGDGQRDCPAESRGGRTRSGREGAGCRARRRSCSNR